jgi:hypothetical protein
MKKAEYSTKRVKETKEKTASPIQSDTQHLNIPKDVSTNTKKLWHGSSSLPEWMNDYFNWYEEELKNLNEENWQSRRYLIMQCLTTDNHCGGTSDRLKPLPLFLLLAVRSKRLFMIRWNTPCALEEFLIPPQEGYNWTVPTFLVKHIDERHAGSRHCHNTKCLQSVMDTNTTFLLGKLQTFDGGSIYFNEQVNDTSYEEIYHDLFRMFFTPSLGVSKIIQEEMSFVGLVAGNYATAHYRVFYGPRKPNETMIASAAINAVECASELLPGGPVYFASDSTFATETIQNYAKQYSRPVVVVQNKEPLHLDKANSTNPEDYYSVFVDLYLLGMGRCGSVGMGGFGRFGLLLSYNASCWNRHLYNKQRLDCSWKDTDSKSQ